MNTILKSDLDRLNRSDEINASFFKENANSRSVSHKKNKYDALPFHETRNELG